METKFCVHLVAQEIAIGDPRCEFSGGKTATLRFIIALVQVNDWESQGVCGGALDISCAFLSAPANCNLFMELRAVDLSSAPGRAGWPTAASHVRCQECHTHGDFGRNSARTGRVGASPHACWSSSSLFDAGSAGGPCR